MLYRRREPTALSDGIWQDREILFDIDARSLRLIPGEYLIERIDNVEDTKGNNGDKGMLRITNIRLLWHNTAMPRINLSIGYNAVHGVTTRVLKSKIRGHAESLYLMARNSTTRFEFVFTCSNSSHTKLFTTVISIHRAFETTKLYRELKMRGALVDEEEKLRILPLEHQCDRVEGAWNLSSDQGNLGVLIITNIRVVWYASMNPLYNVSLPYLQLKSCRVRDSKFGSALVLQTSVVSGSYILGFRIDPEDKLEVVAKTIQSYHGAYLSNPIFGIQHSVDREPSSLRVEDLQKSSVDDDIVLDDRPTRVDAFAAYFSNETGENERANVVATFDEELGVCVEQLKPGFTTSDLWRIDLI